MILMADFDYPDGIANILSLKNASKLGRVTFDSDADNAFHMYKTDGSVRKFVMSEKGLFYLDMSDPTSEVALINTVADNKNKYSACAYSRALLTRKVLGIIGRPARQHYIWLVNNYLIKNCPITREDIMVAEDIWGPDIGSLKGKTTWRKVPHVRAQPENIPLPIMEKYRNITLCVDIMYVNGIAFFMSIS